MNTTARNTLLATVAAALLASAAMTVRAQNDPAQSPTLAIAFADAVEIARATVPGEPREVELDDEDDSPVWEIEMLATDGQEIELVIDASSGAVLSQQADNDKEGDDDD